MAAFILKSKKEEPGLYAGKVKRAGSFLSLKSLRLKYYRRIIEN
jgi:hypothetical protein